MNERVRRLLKTPKGELDNIYRQSNTGSIPVGLTEGWAVAFPGTPLAVLLAWIVRLLIWQGKVFNAAEGTLLNRLSPFGILGIKAKVSRAASWLDGAESIDIDYSQTSFVAKMVHDEVREIEQGLYLGKVYLWKWKTVDFILLV